LKFYPAVNKIWLHLLAGVMWSGVGIMLVGFASRWFTKVPAFQEIQIILAGMALAAAIYFFGFSKMAVKNINRISDYRQEHVCLFAFQRWTSYPLVLFMVSLGIYLRRYSPVPKPYLAVIYIGIGGGLFLSSLHYFARVLHRQTAMVD
jgi:uncharacterized membrane protein